MSLTVGFSLGVMIIVLGAAGLAAFAAFLAARDLRERATSIPCRVVVPSGYRYRPRIDPVVGDVHSSGQPGVNEPSTA